MKKILHGFKKATTALLIIDMQNDFVKHGGYLDKHGKNIKPALSIIPNINRLLELFRKNNLPVIFVKTIHTNYTDSAIWASRYGRKSAPQLCRPGTWGAEFISELQPRPNEPVIVKHRYSAMLYTDLPLILTSKGIKALVITGTQTNVCIESTARDAFMMNFLTVVASDCVATPDEDLHEPSLKNLAKYFGHVMTSDEIIKILDLK